MADLIVEAGREVGLDTLPTGPRSAATRLVAKGYAVRAVQGSAHEWASAAYGEDGEHNRFAVYTTDRALVSESGDPILTPTGKQAVEKVPTDTLVLTHWICLRAAREGRYGVMTWERDTRKPNWRATTGCWAGETMLLGLKAWQALA